MRRVSACCLAMTLLALSAAAGDFFFGDEERGTPLPHRVLQAGNLGDFLPDWADESMPRYAIVANAAEWRQVFPARPGNAGAPQPNAAMFDQAALILVGRVSAAPPAGQPALFVKSFELVNGDAVLTYGFFPPPAGGGRKVKNTLLVAIPLEHVDNIRIMEDIETPESMAAARELEAARAAGLFKPAP